LRGDAEPAGKAKKLVDVGGQRLPKREGNLMAIEVT